ncbi:hypothetical protein E4N62_12090 [Streptomyces sp. MNU76]|uniref:hypothetical protein n=1 Tax=Streptomyces sp. MNU76 TaxID=2560026 RepID=UPI001E2F887E|nr:hypothetical protein [Streptomyces sp. MNU76]MCC9705926.1 hypothetical protein [Streptomyces sp. MNU76]
MPFAIAAASFSAVSGLIVPPTARVCSGFPRLFAGGDGADGVQRAEVVDLDHLRETSSGRSRKWPGRASPAGPVGDVRGPRGDRARRTMVTMT